MIPESAADALAAGLLLALGSCMRGEVRFVLGLPVTLMGFAVASRAMWRAGSGRLKAWTRPTSFLLAAMTIVGLAAPPMPGAGWHNAANRAILLIGLAAAIVFAREDDRWRRRLVDLIVIAAAALHLATPIAVPQPNIDVWSWIQNCLQALMHGVHPYTVQPGDLLRSPYIPGPGPTASIYPYMPLTLIAYAPAFALLGDYRFMSAIAVPATVALHRAIGRRLRLEARLVDATTLGFLLFPRALSMTCYGWTEPLLVVTVAAFVALAIRAPRGAAQAIAFFLLPALKQYVAAPILLYLAFKATRPRPAIIAVAIAVAAATVAPFLIWSWRPTVAGILYLTTGPLKPRLDSNSIVAFVGVTTGAYPGRWLSVAVQCVVAAIAYRRLRLCGLAGLLLASTLALYASFLAGWQAFINYYYLVAEMLLLTSLIFAADAETLTPNR